MMAERTLIFPHQPLVSLIRIQAQHVLTLRVMSETLVICCISGIILAAYIGTIISHYKDPGT